MNAVPALAPGDVVLYHAPEGQTIPAVVVSVAAHDGDACLNLGPGQPDALDAKEGTGMPGTFERLDRDAPELHDCPVCGARTPKLLPWCRKCDNPPDTAYGVIPASESDDG